MNVSPQAVLEKNKSLCFIQYGLFVFEESDDFHNSILWKGFKL